MSSATSATEPLVTASAWRQRLGLAAILGACIALVAGVLVSTALGPEGLAWNQVWGVFFGSAPADVQRHLVMELRLPRAVGAVAVGAALAVSGAILQGLTRNPLASPGLLGANAGSALLLALGFILVPNIDPLANIGVALVGAACGTGLVLSIATLTRGGVGPVTLALIGVAVGALLGAITTGVAVWFDLMRDLAFWYAGTLAGMRPTHVATALPCAGAGLLAAVLLARSLTVLSLGEETARGLGQRTVLVRCAAIVVALLLSGTAVSVAGPVGFVGLIVPHAARALVGIDYRKVIACSALLGALLVVAADLAGRVVVPPHELPLGLLTALVGGPFFLVLARRVRGAW